MTANEIRILPEAPNTQWNRKYLIFNHEINRFLQNGNFFVSRIFFFLLLELQIFRYCLISIVCWKIDFELAFAVSPFKIIWFMKFHVFMKLQHFDLFTNVISAMQKAIKSHISHFACDGKCMAEHLTEKSSYFSRPLFAVILIFNSFRWIWWICMDSGYSLVRFIIWQITDEREKYTRSFLITNFF